MQGVCPMGLVRADVGASGIEQKDRCDSNDDKDGLSTDVQLLLNDGKALAFLLLAVVNNVAFIASFHFFLGAFFSVLTIHSSLLVLLCFKELKFQFLQIKVKVI